jgi:hypothetical protein
MSCYIEKSIQRKTTTNAARSFVGRHLGEQAVPVAIAPLFDITHLNHGGPIMRRIYFLAPNIDVSKKIVDQLLLARIEERHIHVLAKRGTPMENLPEATYLQKSDFIPALQQGLTLGGLTGMIGGLVAMALPMGPVLAGGAVLGISVAGAGLGALMSSMIGSSVGNRRIQQFEDAIENGEFLMMVDVPKDRVEEIEALIRKEHPEAECEGTEPRIPAFP